MVGEDTCKDTYKETCKDTYKDHIIPALPANIITLKTAPWTGKGQVVRSN